jgi:hypothetical protein
VEAGDAVPREEKEEERRGTGTGFIRNGTQ